MTHCPYCDGENIEGADSCQHCEQPLDFLSTRVPQSEVERGLLRDKVRLIASRQPVQMSLDTPVREALERMVEHGVGCCIIVSDDADTGTAGGSQVAGIFSERDALVRLNVDACKLGHLPVSQFMTAAPETIDGDAEIAFALQKMDVGGYRHLPVVDGARVIGVISIRDILQYVSAHLEAVE